ncbi:hypothetical protein K1719_000261 [Acacia pycnantha]|nr:hypothetical protein K1719_000261 [Acacia pycnantha]
MRDALMVVGRSHDGNRSRSQNQKRNPSYFDFASARLKEEANESSISGPVQMIDIVGKVICFLQSAVNHGPTGEPSF